MTITSQGFVSFLSRINQFMKSAEGNVWFRGHSNIGENGEHCNYTLDSTLFRRSKNLKDVQRLERNYIYEFMTKGYGLHQTQNEWNLLYLMQHHGAPTRLLDWTTSLTIALYFATLNWNPEENKPSVWLLNPTKLNTTLGGEDSLILPHGEFEKYVSEENLSSHAIAPIYNTPRLVAQQGQFTLQGNFDGDLKKELDSKDPNHSDVLWELEITKDLYNDINLYLHMNGVNVFSIYPDLDGLSKLINKGV